MPCGVRAGLAALALLVAAAVPASGQDAGDPASQSPAIEQQLGQYRQRYADVDADAVQLAAELTDAQQQEQAASAELAHLDSAVQDADRAVQAAQAATTLAQQQAQAATTAAASARTEADAARGAWQRQALDAYVGQGRFGALTAMLEHTNTDDLLAATYYAHLAGDVQADRVDHAQTASAAADQADQAATFAVARAQSTQADLGRKQQDAQAARDAQAAQEQSAHDTVVSAQQRLVSLQAQKAAYAAQVNQLEADSHDIAASLRAHASTTASPVTSAAPKATPPATRIPKATNVTAPAPKPAPSVTPSPAPSPATTGTAPPPPKATTPSPASTFPQDYSTGNPPVIRSLAYPIPGWPVIGRFAMGVDPVLGVYRMHEGIDIGAPETTPIHAAGPGTVIWAGDRHGYGNAVFIDHGGGVVTVYAHQSRVAVSVGQRVGTGDVIGYVGHTGLAAGPHLHFEVRVNGVAYDPLKFVSPR